MAEYGSDFHPHTKTAFYVFTYVLCREKHMELCMFMATQRWLLGRVRSLINTEPKYPRPHGSSLA